MNVKEAAEYLRLNYMTVYKLAQKNRIPAFKVGGTWRFKKDILDDWLIKNTSRVQRSMLIVDDDAMVRDVLASIVRQQDYSVTTVASGEEALEEIDKQHFDLIFLDLVLPKLSGTDILQAVKKKDKDAVVVIVTGYGDDPIALEAMSLGPLLLIRKPFRKRDIEEVLNMVMKGKSANNANS